MTERSCETTRRSITRIWVSGETSRLSINNLSIDSRYIREGQRLCKNAKIDVDQDNLFPCPLVVPLSRIPSRQCQMAFHFIQAHSRDFNPYSTPPVVGA